MPEDWSEPYPGNGLNWLLLVAAIVILMSLIAGRPGEAFGWAIFIAFVIVVCILWAIGLKILGAVMYFIISGVSGYFFALGLILWFLTGYFNFLVVLTLIGVTVKLFMKAMEKTKPKSYPQSPKAKN
jgi:hypothetical protein